MNHGPPLAAPAGWFASHKASSALSCRVTVALPRLAACTHALSYFASMVSSLLICQPHCLLTRTHSQMHKTDLFTFCFIVLFILFLLILHFLFSLTHTRSYSSSAVCPIISLFLFSLYPPHCKSILHQKLPFRMKRFAPGQRSTCFGWNRGGHTKM